jgi:hypothetical protein
MRTDSVQFAAGLLRALKIGSSMRALRRTLNRATGCSTKLTHLNRYDDNVDYVWNGNWSDGSKDYDTVPRPRRWQGYSIWDRDVAFNYAVYVGFIDITLTGVYEHFIINLRGEEAYGLTLGQVPYHGPGVFTVPNGMAWDIPGPWRTSMLKDQRFILSLRAYTEEALLAISRAFL